MNSTHNSTELPLERYRSYLLVLAKTNGVDRLKGKFDASDIVQQTMLKAHQARDQFRGKDHAELAGWLRQILTRTISDIARDLHRDKRDVGLERSLQASFDQSSCRLEGLLAADNPSPSRQLAHAEELLRISDAIADLPEPQRDAILLKHCQGLSLAEVAERMDRTPAAVASLLRRGLKQLRESLTPQTEQ